MQNAVGGKGERGDQAASQQGRAGLRLQHALPNARVVFVSATGATTVHNLAYAQRLGLWGGEDFPFATRAEFVEAIEDGVVAAMEVLPRSEGTRPLCGPLALLRRRRIRAARASPHTRAGPHLRRLCRRVLNHSQQSRCGDAGREHHRRVGHTERAGEVSGAVRLRIRQAALLRPSADQHEDAVPDPLDRSRSRGGPRRRHPDRLDRRSADGAPAASPLSSFAAGIAADRAAVRAALTQTWSNGQTEGQITKLKLVKRQMYGRANIDLLQARLVHAA